MGKFSLMIMKIICIHVADSLCYTAGIEGDDRGGDGWMASPTQWT